MLDIVYFVSRTMFAVTPAAPAFAWPPRYGMEGQQFFVSEVVGDKNDQFTHTVVFALCAPNTKPKVDKHVQTVSIEV